MKTALFLAATGVTAYTAYYYLKYGPKAVTPAEAWLFARMNRKNLDAELEKILGTTESR